MRAQSIRILSSLTLAFWAGVVGVAGATAPVPRSKGLHAPTSLKSSSLPKSSAKTSLSSSSRKSKSLKHRPAKPRAQMAPTSERISQIQSALAGQGVYQGDPSGKWDDGTVEAMRKYQAAQGLNPSGKLDARTLEKLGLGANTAGRAAPMPRTTPEPNLLISRSQLSQQGPQEDK
jgi:peptidoglycan hydrolase-like protein with peptidoglycan-binding domain